MNRQSKAPIFETLLARTKRKVRSFHTPGHKNGQGIDERLLDYTGKAMYAFDVTVFPEVDSLHDPVSCIKKAQNLMAEAYGVQQSFFLVNGSTVGNQAMLMSACNPGDSVIVSRNAHKSVLAGVILAGLWPIWVQPKVDQNLDIFFDPSPEQIEAALNQFPEAKAVFVTSPTYNGVTADLKRIAEMVHRHGKILLVDEAHGAHLKFHEEMPISAMEAGADLCVQSTHKMLSALSQGSVLHFNTDLVDVNRVKKIVSMLQTTSPSYLTLASIDLARRQAVLSGHKILSKVIKAAEAGRKKINQTQHFFSFTRKEIQARAYDLDVTKLTINVTKSGLSGQEVDAILAKEYNIQVDAADIFNLIAILGIGTKEADVIALTKALEEIDKKYQGSATNWILQIPSLSTEMVLMPREVFLSKKTKRVPIAKAVGYIAAQTLTPYPPGIPVLIPGERITQEICDYLTNLSEKQLRVSGQETDTLRTIKVIGAQ